MKLFLSCNFPKILDENGKYEMKIIMWFTIVTTRNESNPKAAVWNGSEKIVSLKIDVLKKASVPKLYNAFSDILQNNEKLISLTAESRIS